MPQVIKTRRRILLVPLFLFSLLPLPLPLPLLPLLGAALSLATARPASAAPVSHPAGLGVGLMLGVPTGLTLKKTLGGANAWDVGIGFGHGVRLHADYLWGLAQVLPDTSALTLDLYLGVGPALGIARGWCGYAYDPGRGCGDGGVFAGVRVPFGVEARLTRAPVSFGIEIAPGIWVGRDYLSELLDAFLFVRFLL